MENENTKTMHSETDFHLSPMEMAIEGPKAHQVADIDDPLKSSTTSVNGMEEEQERVNGEFEDEGEYIEVEDDDGGGDDDNEPEQEPEQEPDQECSSTTSSTTSLTTTMSDMRTTRTKDSLIHVMNSLQVGVDCLQLLSVILIAFAAVTLFMQLNQIHHSR